MNPESILLYGGTFDPIHLGHIGIARAAARQLTIDRVILIPSARPPHKLDLSLTPFEHRLAMARLAVTDDPLFEVSDCESRRARPSFTLETVIEFQLRFPRANIHWLIGADTIRDLPDWYCVHDLIQTCTIVTARRKDCPDNYSIWKNQLSQPEIDKLNSHIVDTPIFDISSTEIRRRLSLKVDSDNWLNPQVLQYISDHHLYS